MPWGHVAPRQPDRLSGVAPERLRVPERPSAPSPSPHGRSVGAGRHLPAAKRRLAPTQSKVSARNDTFAPQTVVSRPQSSIRSTQRAAASSAWAPDAGGEPRQKIGRPPWKASDMSFNGGDEGIRTPGLCLAKAALSQLSYVPRRIARWLFWQRRRQLSSGNRAPLSTGPGPCRPHEELPRFFSPSHVN